MNCDACSWMGDNYSFNYAFHDDWIATHIFFFKQSSNSYNKWKIIQNYREKKKMWHGINLFGGKNTRQQVIKCRMSQATSLIYLKIHFNIRMTNTEWNALQCDWIFYVPTLRCGVGCLLSPFLIMHEHWTMRLHEAPALFTRLCIHCNLLADIVRFSNDGFWDFYTYPRRNAMTNIQWNETE